jgi:predicted  nucleic acid-binding Zn-ribbon protein
MTTRTSHEYHHLHGLLQQLDDAEKTLAHGPRRIAVTEKKTVAAEQACTDQKEQIQLLKKTVDQSSLNLKSREAEVTKLTLRLNEASSNKEYDIIQAQMAAARAADAELEDQILSLLSQVDEANEELQQRMDEVSDLKQKTASITAETRSIEPGLKSDIERLTAEITDADAVIPTGESRTTYRRLRDAMGPAAMALVEGGFCTACNTGATSQDIVRMNMSEFLLCRACGRILYLIREE